MRAISSMLVSKCHQFIFFSFLASSRFLSQWPAHLFHFKTRLTFLILDFYCYRLRKPTISLFFISYHHWFPNLWTFFILGRTFAKTLFVKLFVTLFVTQKPVYLLRGYHLKSEYWVVVALLTNAIIKRFPPSSRPCQKIELSLIHDLKLFSSQPASL